MDELTGQVIFNGSEDRAGEVGLAGQQTSNEELLVYAFPGGVRSDDKVEDLPVGELPLKYAIPLARRRLAQRQADSGTVNMPVIGYDRSLLKGTPITPVDRESFETFGSFIITGRTITINRNGVTVNYTGRGMASAVDTYQEIGSTQIALFVGTSVMYEYQIDCTDGYVMFLAGSGPDLSIEARRKVINPFLGWVNLTGGGILDLSPYAGTKQTFQFKIGVTNPISVYTREEAVVMVDIGTP